MEHEYDRHLHKDSARIQLKIKQIKPQKIKNCVHKPIDSDEHCSC